MHLDRFLTAREVLTYHGRPFGLSRQEAGERANELLGGFDLSAKAATKPNTLSGGNAEPAAWISLTVATAVAVAALAAAALGLTRGWRLTP